MWLLLRRETSIYSLQSRAEEPSKSSYAAGCCKWSWSPSIGCTVPALLYRYTKPKLHTRSRCVGLVSLRPRQNHRPSSAWRCRWPCRRRLSVEVSAACSFHCNILCYAGGEWVLRPRKANTYMTVSFTCNFAHERSEYVKILGSYKMQKCEKWQCSHAKHTNK